MAVNYAEKYSPIVDERFKLGSLTGGMTNNEYDWIGVETVNVYSIPTAAMNNYTLTGSNRYGTPAELENAVQEMKVTQDRSFTFTIDRKSHDDTMMVMEAGRALRRQIDEVCVPEVDTYRIAAYVAGCKSAHVHNSADVSASGAVRADLPQITSNPAIRKDLPKKQAFFCVPRGFVKERSNCSLSRSDKLQLR